MEHSKREKYEEENKKCRNKYNYYSSVVIVNSKMEYSL